ncbi:MAG TPA: ParA family protein [Candidatus Binatia bacterium]|nr:ParA family protein [Candidatus Binatia bacterium]
MVAVVANKGGVGKSTLAFQVAGELALGGERVLAVDADKQADLTLYARGPRIAGLGLDAVLGDPRGACDPRPFIGPVSANLDLLGSSDRLAVVDRVLAQVEHGAFHLRSALDAVKHDYRWAVIDTGHSELMVSSALVAADLLLMPTTASAPDARHAGDMVQRALSVRTELGLPCAGLVGRSMITVWRRQHNGIADAQVIDELHRRYGDLVCAVVIPHSSRVSEANAQRMTVRQHAEMYGTGRDAALRAVTDAFRQVTDCLRDRALTPESHESFRWVSELPPDEPDAAELASALRRLKRRRGLDDDQLAEVLGRPVEWIRQTLAFGARHPDGEERLTIRPHSRRPACDVASPRPQAWLR